MNRTPTPAELIARVRELAAKAGICTECDGTGHVVADDGKWRRCDCQIGAE